MKSHRKGWTLIEVLISTSILAVLVMVMAEALNTTQRSWLASRSAAERQQTVDSAISVLSREVRQAMLASRPSYDTALDKLVPASDLHFVCGPAAELLPGVPGVCGDAVFFQRPGRDGDLQRAMQACGFFVQFGGDEVWRPTFLTALPSNRRLRLLQFHQPAENLTLFQPTAVIGEASRLSQLTSRSDLYNWFVQPLSDTGAFKSSVSVVAENVVAMIVQASPSAQRCYDSRRFQWEAGSAEAALSRHQLPDMMDVTLVMVDEAGWARLAQDEAESLAAVVMSFVKAQSWQPETLQKSLDGLQALLQNHRLSTRISVMTAGMASP